MFDVIPYVITFGSSENVGFNDTLASILLTEECLENVSANCFDVNHKKETLHDVIAHWGILWSFFYYLIFKLFQNLILI